MAGYIDAESGRALTFALFVDDAGPPAEIGGTLRVFEDEARIAGIVYELNRGFGAGPAACSTDSSVRPRASSAA